MTIRHVILWKSHNLFNCFPRVEYSDCVQFFSVDQSYLSEHLTFLYLHLSMLPHHGLEITSWKLNFSVIGIDVSFGWHITKLPSKKIDLFYVIAGSMIVTTAFSCPPLNFVNLMSENRNLISTGLFLFLSHNEIKLCLLLVTCLFSPVECPRQKSLWR